MTYGNLNLDASGPLAKELFGQVDEEADQGDIRLTSAHNANIDNPSNCTPRMVSWCLYCTRISGHKVGVKRPA